jgi:hypothetical protein
MNNRTGSVFQQDVVSTGSADSDKEPPEEEKPQEVKNIDLRSWLKFPYGPLLLRKIANRTERRKIIAFAVAASFLLFSFWNSLNQNQLQRDLAKSKVDETLISGKTSESLQDHAEARNTVVIYIEIDSDGKAVIPPGTPADMAKQLQSMKFDPPKRNGIPVHVKIPIPIRIEK